MARTGMIVEWLGVLVDDDGDALPGVPAAVGRLAMRQVPVVAIDPRANGGGSLAQVIGPLRPLRDHHERFILPRPGLILRAAQEHDLDLPTSWVIARSDAFAHAAAQAGCAGCVLIGTAPPDEDLGIVVAQARDFADAPRVMIPRDGGCWHAP